MVPTRVAAPPVTKGSIVLKISTNVNKVRVNFKFLPGLIRRYVQLGLIKQKHEYKLGWP